MNCFALLQAMDLEEAAFGIEPSIPSELAQCIPAPPRHERPVPYPQEDWHSAVPPVSDHLLSLTHAFILQIHASPC